MVLQNYIRLRRSNKQQKIKKRNTNEKNIIHMGIYDHLPSSILTARIQSQLLEMPQNCEKERSN